MPQASLAGLVLENVVTADLQIATAEEMQRRVASLRARESKEARLLQACRADPPIASELAGAVVHVDCIETSLALEAAVARNHAYLVGPAERHCARIFIADDPWAPRADEVTWAAVLLGGWAMTPAVYMQHAQGPAILYKPALATRRQVWVSQEVRTQLPELWMLILQSMQAAPPAQRRWKLLHSARAWAEAKAAAISAGKPAEVLALVLGQVGAGNHVMGPSAFFKFIKQAKRSMLGLGDS